MLRKKHSFSFEISIFCSKIHVTWAKKGKRAEKALGLENKLMRFLRMFDDFSTNSGFCTEKTEFLASYAMSSL